MTIESKRKDHRRKKPDVGAHLNPLPATYKFAAEALKTMAERGGSIGSIVVNGYKSYNVKLIYALAMNTVKNIKIIKKIIYETKLDKKVTINDPFLLEILVGDLLYGQGLKKVEQNSTASSLINLKDSIIKQRDALKAEYSVDEDMMEAKYIRVNHLKCNMKHVLGQLKVAGMKQVEYSKDKIKFKKFLNKFKDMDQKEFMLDFHFPDDLIILKRTANLKKLEFLRKGKAMLQDKASFMAVEALNIKPTQKVIDACCAPGCKTTIIGERMKNKGKIFAFDKDKKRLLSANHILKLHGITCAQTQIQDFTKVNLKRLAKTHGIERFDSILIDPSCSGSGIKSRLDYKTSHMEGGRLKKLQAFQVAMLTHVLKADVSNTIVYCTCSKSVEENEQVVEMSLNESGVKSLWDVIDPLPYWPHRGEENYEFGSKCIRSDENSLTNGFFIAKLERNKNSKPVTSAKDKKKGVDSRGKSLIRKDDDIEEDAAMEDGEKLEVGNAITDDEEPSSEELTDDKEASEDDEEDEEDDDDENEDEEDDADEDDEESMSEEELSDNASD